LPPPRSTRARVDDDERTQAVVDLDVRWRHDPDERVIDRSLERAAIGDRLPLVVQERRVAGRLVGEPVVAALTQHVPERERALREIDAVAHRVLPDLQRVPRLRRL